MEYIVTVQTTTHRKTSNSWQNWGAGEEQNFVPLKREEQTGNKNDKIDEKTSVKREYTAL